MYPVETQEGGGVNKSSAASTDVRETHLKLCVLVPNNKNQPIGINNNTTTLRNDISISLKKKNRKRKQILNYSFPVED